MLLNVHLVEISSETLIDELFQAHHNMEIFLKCCVCKIRIT